MEKIKFFHSIRFKFIICIMALIVVILGMVYFVFSNHERQTTTRRINREGILLTDLLTTKAGNFILDSDQKGMQSIVNNISKDRNVAYVHIYSADTKQLLATYSKEDHNLGKKDVDELLRILMINWLETRTVSYNNNSYMDFSQNFKSNGKSYAVISIGLSLDIVNKLGKIYSYYIFTIGLASMLIGVILAVFLSNMVVNPTEKIFSIVRLISTGEFSQKVSIKTNDEFGVLARAFNKMSRNVANLYHVISAMNYMNDSKDVLRLILNKAVDALKADHGSIMLLDENEEYLEVARDIIHGLKKKEIKEFLRIPVGEGIAGRVVKAVKDGDDKALNELMIVNSGFQDNKFKIFRPEQDYEKNVKSLLCVPLKSDQKIFGVINIVNRLDGSAFEKDDCQFLNTLASQAAISLTKAKLYEDSITDGLTRLYIHRYFQNRLSEEIKRAERYKLPVSLLMIDIDHFKNLNDTYGHQQGDTVLSSTSAIIRNTIREDIDIACRYGGEELAVIMPQTDAVGAQTLAERLRQKIEENIYSNNNTDFFITVSMGIATYPDAGKEKEELIKKADGALYLAKACGRNRVISATEVPF